MQSAYFFLINGVIDVINKNGSNVTFFIFHGHNDPRLFIMNHECFRETDTERLSVTMVTDSSTRV